MCHRYMNDKLFQKCTETLARNRLKPTAVITAHDVALTYAAAICLQRQQTQSPVTHISLIDTCQSFLHDQINE